MSSQIWRYDFHWGKSNLDMTVWWPDLPIQPCKSWNWLDPSLFTFPQCYSNSPIGATKTLGDTRTSTQSSCHIRWHEKPASINQDVLNCFDRFMGSVLFWRGSLNEVCWCQSGVTQTHGLSSHAFRILSPVRVEEGGAWNTGRGAFLTWSRRFFGPILEGFQWIWQLRWEHACCFPGRAIELEKFKMKPEIHPKGEV